QLPDPGAVVGWVRAKPVTQHLRALDVGFRADRSLSKYGRNPINSPKLHILRLGAYPGTRAIASTSSRNSGFTSRSMTSSVLGGYLPPGNSFGKIAERASNQVGMVSALVR